MFVRTCLQCVKVAGGTTIRRPQGEQLIATMPSQILHFDFLSMPTSEEGFKYILVLKCGFSNFIELVPSASPTSAVAATALLDWFKRFNVAPVWITDQGPHFKNAVMDTVRRHLKCQHHFVTPYAHWANGSVERVNREVLRLLRALVSENQMNIKQWPYLLAAVQSILNKTPTARLGDKAPLTVLSGLRPTHPLDAIFPVPLTSTDVASNARAVKSITMSDRVKTYVTNTAAALQDIHKAALDKGQRIRAGNRKAAEKRGWQPHAGFDVGDYVLVAIEKPDNKLAVRWAGPMQIVKIVDEWTFTVKDLVHGRTFDRHAQMLKKYEDKQLEVTSMLKEQLVHDDAVMFRVEKIMDWRKKARHPVEVLVRWVGLDAASDS